MFIKYGSKQGRPTAAAHAETPPSASFTAAVWAPPPPPLAWPPLRSAEVQGEGREGRARADVCCARRYLARRLSHEPCARSATPPPVRAVNEALPATWGASSTWTPEPT